MGCSHTFTWWSVVPPSHCPQCGACLHPAHTAPKVWPTSPSEMPMWHPNHPSYPYRTVVTTTTQPYGENWAGS